MIGRHAERFPPKPVVALQGPDAGARRLNQVLDDRSRDVVAVQGGLECARIAARPRLKPVALADAVVERRVGVEAVLIGLVQRAERQGAIGLLAPGGQDRAILPIRHRHVFPGRQSHGLEFRVGGGERPVRVVRRGGEPARERHQSLPSFVEHVLLLTVQILDCKPVEPQRFGFIHPRAHGGQRNFQEFRVEPGLGLLPPREENLDLLTLGANGVVALILVVSQRRKVPDTVGELPERFRQPERFEQLLGATRQRALERGVAVDSRPRAAGSPPPTPPSW